MPLFRGNDTNLVTDALKDSAGEEITAGTVEAEIFTKDGVTSLISKSAMIHDAGGVWKRTLQAEDIDGISAERVLIRVTVGDPADATFERVEAVTDRRSG